MEKKKLPTKRKRSGAWEKRKGTGTTKGWKKKPGGVKKKFKHGK